jgi:hypothetical protein
MPISLQDITLHGASTFLVALGTGWLIYFVKNGLPAYLAEKGKNLATKEDIGHLTDIVERVRLQFSQVNTVHRVQFEAEFQAYQALQVAAHSAYVAYVRCRSLSNDPADGTLEEFVTAHLAFTESIVCHEPFIPDSVCSKFKALDELLLDVRMDVQLKAPKMPADRREERTAIREARQQSVEAIKQRLASVLVILRQ